MGIDIKVGLISRISICFSSEAARQRAHDIRNEALQLVEDRKTRTDRSQSDATLKINERVSILILIFIVSAIKIVSQ